MILLSAYPYVYPITYMTRIGAVHKRHPHKIAKLDSYHPKNVRTASTPSPFVRADTP